MVAETHTSFAELRRSDVIDFILNTVAKIDVDPGAAGAVTLSDCGFLSVLQVDELAEIVGEEYGERTLVGDGLEEIDGSWTVVDFVSTLYPDLTD